MSSLMRLLKLVLMLLAGLLAVWFEAVLARPEVKRRRAARRRARALPKS